MVYYVSTVIGPGSDCTVCSHLNESRFLGTLKNIFPAIRCAKLVMREARKQMTLAFIFLSPGHASDFGVQKYLGTYENQS